MNEAPVRSPSVGQRIRVNGHVGTIKYIGEITGTNGAWLGVEWDDAARGKHDGSKDGKQYFSCRVPGSGSFIRPSSSVSYGQSFLRALISKYVDAPQSSAATGRKEMVVLGSSNGAIEVEAVGFDKVRSKLAKMERLREISLISEDVAWTDPPGKIKEMLPNVRSLDLSNSLLPSWDMAALIAIELPELRELSLNSCRLLMPSNLNELYSSFSSLEELRINHTLTSWNEATILIYAMPKLEHLELGDNRLESLDSETKKGPGTATKLTTLNLDENKLQEWTDIMSSIAQLPSLERLILTSNGLQTITDPAAHSTAPGIKHLGLQDNAISAWRDVNALSAWVPGLQTLNMSGNPLTTVSRDFRQQAIARLPALMSLNGTQISAKERNDCEVYYLAKVARSNFASDAERTRHHPRWQDLCAKHGRPEDGSTAKGLNTLAGRLININIYCCDSDVPENEAVSSALQGITAGQLMPIELKVLPTMNIKTLRLKLTKALKLRFAGTHRNRNFSIWLLVGATETFELTSDYDGKELSWLGFQEGSSLLVQL